MKAFSFVHAADLHLGYGQYGLEVRRQDFDDAFSEVVDKTIGLKPDFMIIAGDLFHQARPSNVTLEGTIRSFKRLRDAEIPVLTVDGSHDSAPNAITGTILNPLDSAGLIYHLPKHENACWEKPDCCYVAGVPNFHNKRRTEEGLPSFLEQHSVKADPHIRNILVFHLAVALPSLIPSCIEAEASPSLIPDGFDYYAAGHIHKRHLNRFKSGLLAYSGSTETVSYDEAKDDKGFYHVRVDEKGTFSPEFIVLTRLRKFLVIEKEFSGWNADKVTQAAVEMVKSADQEGAIVIPVLKGVLPSETNRSEIDIVRIKGAAEKALLVHPIVSLRESAVSEEIARSIFESEIKDLKTKSYEYFMQIFSDRYGREQADRIARSAISLIEPLTKKQREKVQQTLEEMLK